VHFNVSINIDIKYFAATFAAWQVEGYRLVNAS